MMQMLSKYTSLAGGVAILAALSGCYRTDTPLFDKGISMNIVGKVSCASGSGTPTIYDVTKTSATKNLYHATVEGSADTMDLLFRPSFKPFVLLMQMTIEGKSYYSTVNVLTGQIRYVTTLADGVADTAKRHKVTLTEQSYVYPMQGTPADEISFLNAVIDKGSSDLTKCSRL